MQRLLGRFYRRSYDLPVSAPVTAPDRELAEGDRAPQQRSLA
jgi:hypothetical protein